MMHRPSTPKKLAESAEQPELLVSTTMSLDTWQQKIHAWVAARATKPGEPTPG